MNSTMKRSIFWFEYEPDVFELYIQALKKKYDFTIGAYWELIKQKRQKAFDLVLLDLMIHANSFHYEYEENVVQKVQNISFTGVQWRVTGVEFLLRIREGGYVGYGFNKDVPVIVATGFIDSSTQKYVKELGVSKFLQKPFSIHQLESILDNNLAPLKNGVGNGAQSSKVGKQSQSFLLSSTII